ncbi:uncharacterized protein UTRI_00611_B [Ustilago trichophora]|uniref:Uncharacterized protein n=1 Tax=Ustilago trichophora TaxID=86804 RepID=A0A5C3DPU1_9BASI|nr:uncharacterized protein UTRI_00611_B [Ustilago trichophora]
MTRLSTVLSLFVLLASSSVMSYKLSPVDGQADIGAYHVQPGRCADVEKHLGRKVYENFFHSSPFQTSFTPTDPESYNPNPPPSHGIHPDVNGAGSGVESMDATSLCSFNPKLTEGYGGGFDKMKLYLVYSRCLYGTEQMRVLCGSTDGKGKPDKIANLVQAGCPTGTKCKNLCATMRDPSLTSQYAAPQVQLAQCMELDFWQKLTDMYKPKAPGQPDPPNGKGNGDKSDPKVVDKAPKEPTKDQTHPDQDGTIPGKVLNTGTGANQPANPPKNPNPQHGPKASTPPKPEAASPDPAPQPQNPPHTTGHLVVAGGFSAFSLYGQPRPAQPEPQPAQPKPEPKQPDQAQPGKLPPQNAPTDMGFRKRHLQKDGSLWHSQHRHGRSAHL